MSDSGRWMGDEVPSMRVPTKEEAAEILRTIRDVQERARQRIADIRAMEMRSRMFREGQSE